MDPFIIGAVGGVLVRDCEVRLRRGGLHRGVTRLVASITTNQREAMLKGLKALPAGDDRIQLLRSAEKLNEARYKDEYEARLDILETLIRDAWMLALDAPAASVVNEDLLPQLRAISAKLDRRRPGGWISQIEELREQLIVNINRKPATDALFLSMAGV